MTKLLMGVAREDITPHVGGRLAGYQNDFRSTHIHDNLTATAFAFTYGEVKALMISFCICCFSYPVATQFRMELSKKLNIPFENIIFSMIHTHSGPSLIKSNSEWRGSFDEEYYNEIFRPAVFAAAEKAFENSEYVKVGFASGISLAGINRRQLTLKNKVILGQNPWGVFNPEMNVISFKNDREEVVANMIYYSAHATAAGLHPGVSRDWPGIMTDALENESGGVTAFFNGTFGDVGPRLSNGETSGNGDFSYVEEVGAVAAKDAINIYKTISEYKDVSISVASGTLRFPLMPRKPYDEVCKICSEADENAQHTKRLIQDFYFNVKKSYEEGYVEKEYEEYPQTALRIGDIVFATIPFETFTEIGLRIDAGVEDLKALVLSFGQGSKCYFPTEDQIVRGGYEVTVFKHSGYQQYADNSDFHAVLDTIETISKIKR